MILIKIKMSSLFYSLKEENSLKKKKTLLKYQKPNKNVEK
jgi:hypothetical protein